MRVLITLQPADGHLNPMLGLSAALRDAGHEVLFATSASFAPRVEARGERAVAAGVDWLESDGPVEPYDPTVDPTEQPPIFERMFLRGIAAAMVDDLPQVVDEFRPDVVLRDVTEFAGPAIAEQRGIPCATFDLTFPIDHHVMTTTGDIHDDRPLDAVRARAGLGPAADPDWFRGQLVITTYPERYRGDRPIRDPFVTIRPNVLHIVDDAEVPPWVDDLEDAVYVSLGTVFTAHFPHVLTTAALGAAATGHQTIATYGQSATPDAFDVPPDSGVRLERYVPQGPVLDRCAAAVTHGGTGTTLGALARGVPVVVIPLGADQFAHAGNVERLGCGVALAHEELTPGAVTDALRTVIDEPSFRDAAGEVAADLAALPGPEVAVDALERLAAG